MQDMLAMAILLDQLTLNDRRHARQNWPRHRPTLFGWIFRRAVGRIDEASCR